MDATDSGGAPPPVAMLAEAMGVPPPPSTAAEAAEWLNTALAALWPFMAAYGSRVIATQGQAALSTALPAWLGTLIVAEVSLGAIPPRVGGVVVVPDEPAAAAGPPPTATQEDGGGDPGATTDGVHGGVNDPAAAARSVTVEADLVYAGDAVVSIDLDTPLTGRVRLGVRHLSLSGRLLLTACPLLPVLPLAGACSAAFVMPPVVGFDLTGWADVDRLQWVRSALTAAVRNVLGGVAALPARLVARLDPSVDFFAVRSCRGGAGVCVGWRRPRERWGGWKTRCPCLCGWEGDGYPRRVLRTLPHARLRGCRRPFRPPHSPLATCV